MDRREVLWKIWVSSVVMNWVFGTVIYLTLAALMFAQTPSYDSLIGQAKTASDGGDLSQAFDLATQAINLNQSRWEAYLIAGSVRLRQGNCTEASSLLQKAIDRAPDQKKSGISELESHCIANRTEPAKAAQPTKADSESESGQAVQGGGPTLADTMNFIQQKLNGEPEISYEWSDAGACNFHDLLSVSEGTADPQTCTISFKVTDQMHASCTRSTTRMIYKYNVPLRSLQDLQVSRMQNELATSPLPMQVSLTAASIGKQYEEIELHKGKPDSTKEEPEVLVRSAEVPFEDETTAARVAKAIKYASSLCGAKPAPF